MEEEKTTGRLAELLRIGGYFIAGGALVGFSIGLYLLLNRALFSFLIGIGSQFEVMNYFLAVFIPSFVILIVVGYLFATTMGLKKVDLSNIVPLCVLSLLCMVLSVLSIFYFISFFGGLLTLAALIRAYTRPAFKTLAKREAFFLMEIGAMFVVFFALLFFSMWLVSIFFITYAMGFYITYSPYALLLVAIVSFLMFFAIPLWGSQGTNAGASAVLGSTMIILSYLFVVQNQYALFNASANVGIFMLVLGFISAVVGDLLYVRIFFFEPLTPTALASQLLYQGNYCPYCGEMRVDPSRNLCSHCGYSVLWTPYAPFCSSCGRLVPTNAKACPHCEEDLENKRIYFGLQTAEEQAIATKLIEEAKKEKSWTTKQLLKVGRILHTIRRTLGIVIGLLSAVIERLDLTSRQTVVILILTYFWAFLAFIGYVRIEPSTYGTRPMFIFYYGLPLGWIQVYWVPRPVPYVVNVDILWIPLVFDFMLYFIGSLALVYALVRFRKLSQKP